MSLERPNSSLSQDQGELVRRQEKRPEKQIKEVLGAIKKIGVEDEFKNDPQQIKLLEKKKFFVKSRIEEVWIKINEYMKTISDLEKVKLEKDSCSQEEFLEKLKQAEDARTIKHDALIATLHSTIRFIAYNFGNIDPKALENWEEEQEERGLEILHAKRIDFPKNILCPDKIDLQERKDITAWAAELYASAQKIKRRSSANK